MELLNDTAVSLNIKVDHKLECPLSSTNLGSLWSLWFCPDYSTFAFLQNDQQIYCFIDSQKTHLT